MPGGSSCGTSWCWRIISWSSWAVFIIFHIIPSRAAFSVLPACLVWFVDAFAVSLLLGIFGARFRDIPPIIGSVMQIAFYLTPIMWSPVMLEHRGLAVVLVKLNPFYSLLEIMRGPLLGSRLTRKPGS